MRNTFRTWFWPVLVGLIGLWVVAGAPPFGPLNLMNSNMGFGNEWDCPPNVKPSATVCIKRLPAQPATP